MEKKSIFVLFILCFLSGFTFGQNSFAYIQKDSAFKNQHHKYTFQINRVKIFETDTLIKVPIQEMYMDSIILFVNGKAISKAYMKLSPDIEYVLQYNMCSQYTLRPVSNPLLGMTQFEIQSTDTLSYIVEVDDLDSRILNRFSEDEYYYTPPSAMCWYAPRFIAIKTLEDELIASKRFHFLHGELLKVDFDSDKKVIRLSVSGYVKSKASYRYYYSK